MKYFCLLIFTSFLAGRAAGQATPVDEAPTYKGLRLSLFQFELLHQSAEAVSLRCMVANTGRYAVAFDKRQAPPAALVIELDTLNLPPALLGWESQVGAALLQEKIALQPGELHPNLILKFRLVRSAPPVSLAAASRPEKTTSVRTTCGDLLIDTAFIVQRDARSMVLRCRLRNVGSAPVRLIQDRQRQEANVALNAYFVREAKITRGAILAAGIFWQQGQDLPNGLLQPGQQTTGEIEISLRDRTRFAPNVVLEINPFQSVSECDPANNTFALPLDF